MIKTWGVTIPPLFSNRQQKITYLYILFFKIIKGEQYFIRRLKKKKLSKARMASLVSRPMHSSPLGLFMFDLLLLGQVLDLIFFYLFLFLFFSILFLHSKCFYQINLPFNFDMIFKYYYNFLLEFK